MTTPYHDHNEQEHQDGYDRYQRGHYRMMELVSTDHSNTFDHVKLAESYQTLDADLTDYIVSFAFGDTYTRTSLTPPAERPPTPFSAPVAACW